MWTATAYTWDNARIKSLYINTPTLSTNGLRLVREISPHENPKISGLNTNSNHFLHTIHSTNSSNSIYI
jgi:hypothetical protein